MLIKKKKKFTKNINFKLETNLRYWTNFWYIRKGRIFLFCQKTIWNVKRDLKLNLYLKDNLCIFKYISKASLLQFCHFKIYRRLLGYNTFILLHNINNIYNIEKKLKENNIKILGFYLNKMLFYGVNIQKINKNSIIESLNKKISIFLFFKKNLINLFRIIVYKFFLLLKKKIYK